MIRMHTFIPYFIGVTHGNKGKQIHIVFAYEHLSILKDGEIFDFIPVRSKQIVIDVNTKKLVNKEDVLAFKSRDKQLYYSLSDFFELTDVKYYLDLLLFDWALKTAAHAHSQHSDDKNNFDSSRQHELEIRLFEIQQQIDAVLDVRDKEAFIHLTNEKKKIEEELELITYSN